jgi:hypothetical protein
LTGGDKYFGSRDGAGLSNKYDSNKLHPVPNAKKHHQGVCIPAKKGIRILCNIFMIYNMKMQK